MAEKHRKKLAEIELKGVELEDELSEVSEKAEESGSTRICPQLTIEENDRTRHWVESVDHINLTLLSFQSRAARLFDSS